MSTRYKTFISPKFAIGDLVQHKFDQKKPNNGLDMETAFEVIEIHAVATEAHVATVNYMCRHIHTGYGDVDVDFEKYVSLRETEVKACDERLERQIRNEPEPAQPAEGRIPAPSPETDISDIF